MLFVMVVLKVMLFVMMVVIVLRVTMVLMILRRRAVTWVRSLKKMRAHFLEVFNHIVVVIAIVVACQRTQYIFMSLIIFMLVLNVNVVLNFMMSIINDDVFHHPHSFSQVSRLYGRETRIFLMSVKLINQQRRKNVTSKTIKIYFSSRLLLTAMRS